MGSHAKQSHTPAPADELQATGRDRRAVRTVDLTDEDITAIEASEMAPGSSILMPSLSQSRPR